MTWRYFVASYPYHFSLLTFSLFKQKRKITRNRFPNKNRLKIHVSTFPRNPKGKSVISHTARNSVGEKILCIVTDPFFPIYKPAAHRPRFPPHCLPSPVFFIPESVGVSLNLQVLPSSPSLTDS